MTDWVDEIVDWQLTQNKPADVHFCRVCRSMFKFCSYLNPKPVTCPECGVVQ